MNTGRKTEFRRAGWGSEAEAGAATNIGICEEDQLDQAAEFAIPRSCAILLRQVVPQIKRTICLSESNQIPPFCNY